MYRSFPSCLARGAAPGQLSEGFEAGAGGVFPLEDIAEGLPQPAEFRLLILPAGIGEDEVEKIEGAGEGQRFALGFSVSTARMVRSTSLPMFPSCSA